MLSPSEVVIHSLRITGKITSASFPFALLSEMGGNWCHGTDYVFENALLYIYFILHKPLFYFKEMEKNSQ